MRPNILLVILDAARAQNMSFMGYDQATTPVLSEFSSESIRYSRAVSNAPWTLPSHATMFTGQMPSEHGMNRRTVCLNDRVPTLAERLQQSGYHTFGISNNPFISSTYGMTRGFDEFVDHWSMNTAVDNEEQGSPGLIQRLLNRFGLGGLMEFGWWRLKQQWFLNDSGAEGTNEVFHRWLDEDGSSSDQPFFTFINYMEPHSPYDPPEPFRSRFGPRGWNGRRIKQEPWAFNAGAYELSERELATLRSWYDAEIAYLDRRIGDLLNLLDQRGLLEDTLVIITSDHGENIGDHGLMSHDFCLYETLLHVPLVVHHPDGGAEDRNRLVQLIDIPQTLLTAAGIDGGLAPDPGRPDRPGRDLLSDDYGHELVVSQYLAPQPPIDTLQRLYPSSREQLQRLDRKLQAVRMDQWKLILGSDGSRELYDVEQDPDETTDLSQSARGSSVIDSMLDRAREAGMAVDFDRSGLTASDGAAGGSIDDEAMDEVLKERLRDLGYLE